MTFDDDKDGKLDHDELTKFAEHMMAHVRPGQGERPPREPSLRDGDAGKREGERRRLEGLGDRERPPRGPDAGERPARPEGDRERAPRGRRPDGEGRAERPGRPLDDAPPPADAPADAVRENP